MRQNSRASDSRRANLVSARPVAERPALGPSPAAMRRGEDSRVQSDVRNAPGGVAGGRWLRPEVLMPQEKDFKRLVRRRMEETGERYTEARAALVRTQPRPSATSERVA